MKYQNQEELTTEFKLETSNRDVLNSFSTSAIFPDNLLDSIRKTAEYLFSKKLDANVVCIYKRSKNGEKKTSIPLNGVLEGMPSNTFKGAILSSKSDYYIKLQVIMNSGGQSIVLRDKTKSKIKPTVSVYASVFDKEKNIVWKNKAKLKDFSKLRAMSTFFEGISVKGSETIEPEDIYMMYKISLLELFKND